MNLSRAMIRKSRKIASFLLATIYFAAHIVLPDLALANIWEVRQPAVSTIRPPRADFHDSDGPIFRPKRTLNDTLSAAASTHGKLLKASSSKNDSSLRRIIHVQDIHENAEAQTHIFHFIKNLADKEAVSLLALEGAFEEVDLSPFREYKNQSAVKHTADYLFKNGRMSGAVYAAFLSQKSIPLIQGVDDRSLYAVNARAVKNAFPTRESARAEVAAFQSEVHKEKFDTYSEELKNFDAAVQAYRSGDALLDVYLTTLARAAEKTGVRLPSQNGFTAFLSALALEKSIDFKAVEKERERFIESLLKNLPRANVSALMNLTQAFQRGAIKHEEFYGAIKKMAQTHGVPLSPYPTLLSYISYVTLADSVDLETLNAAASDLESRIFQALAKTPEQKGLVRRDRHLYLAEKLVQLALTRVEWEEYREVRSTEYGVRSPRKEINNLPFATHDARRTAPLEDFESFYEAAVQRDLKMAENFVAALPKENDKAVVLVSGGFHSQGLEREILRLARQKGERVEIQRFIPTLTKVDVGGGSDYLSAFAREKTPLDKLFDGPKLFIPLHVVPDLGGAALAVSMKNESDETGENVVTRSLQEAEATLEVDPQTRKIERLRLGMKLSNAGISFGIYAAVVQAGLLPFHLAVGGGLALLAGLYFTLFPFNPDGPDKRVDKTRRSFIKKMGLGFGLTILTPFETLAAWIQPAAQEPDKLTRARKEAYQAEEMALASALAIDDRNSPFTTPNRSLIEFLGDETLERIIPNSVLRGRFLRGEFDVEMTTFDGDTGDIKYIYAHERLAPSTKGQIDAYTNYHTGEIYSASVVRIDPKAGTVTPEKLSQSGFPAFLPIVVAKIPIDVNRPTFPSEYLKFLKVVKENGRVYAWVHYQDRGNYPVEDVRVWTNGDLEKADTVVLPDTGLLGRISGMVSENYFSGQQNVERLHLRPQVFEHPGYIRLALRTLREIWPQNALDFEAARQILRTINTSTPRGKAGLEILKRGWEINTAVLEADATLQARAAKKAQKDFSELLKTNWEEAKTEELLQIHLQGLKHPGYDDEFVTAKYIPSYKDVRLLAAEFRNSISPVDPANEAVAAILKGQNPKILWDEDEKSAFDQYMKERAKLRPDVKTLHQDIIKKTIHNTEDQKTALKKITNPLTQYGEDHPYRRASEMMTAQLGDGLSGTLSPTQLAKIQMAAAGIGEDHDDYEKHLAYMSALEKDDVSLLSATRDWLLQSGRTDRHPDIIFLTRGYVGKFGPGHSKVAEMYRTRENDAERTRWRLSGVLKEELKKSEEELAAYEKTFGTKWVDLQPPVDRNDPYYREYITFLQTHQEIFGKIKQMEEEQGDPREIARLKGVYKEMGSKLLYSDHETFTIAFSVGLQLPRFKYHAIRDVLEEEQPDRPQSNSLPKPPKLPDMVIAAIMVGLYFTVDKGLPSALGAVQSADFSSYLPGSPLGVVLAVLFILTARPSHAPALEYRFYPHRAESRSLLEWFVARLKGTELNLGLEGSLRLDRALKKSRRLQSNEVDMYFLGKMDERQEAVFAEAVRKKNHSVVFVNSEDDENRVNKLFSKLEAVTVIRLSEETGYNGAWVSLGRLDTYLKNAKHLSPALHGALLTANGANIFQTRTGPNLVALGAPKTPSSGDRAPFTSSWTRSSKSQGPTPPLTWAKKSATH